MIYLAYCSAATRLLDSEALAELLRVCRANNERAGLTGLLLYHDGSFMQVLEGESEAVRAAYRRIQNDPRHRSLIKLAEAPLPQRNFGRWAMAFTDTQSLGPADLDAYSRFLHEPPEARADSPRAIQLLLSFRELIR